MNKSDVVNEIEGTNKFVPQNSSVLAIGHQKSRLALGSERLPHGRHVNQVNARVLDLNL